jgi:hypothetical protein
MSEKVVEDWTLPPGDRKSRASTDESILNVLRDLKISYPAEIVGFTGFSRQTVFDRLFYLKTRGIVEKVRLGNKAPPDIKARLPDLWDQGIKGASLKRMSWYRIKEAESV